MQTKELLPRIGAALLAAALACGITASGIVDAADSVVSDAYYQHESAGGEDIVIVEIDERAMQELGPWPWSRSVMADVIRTLNSAEDGSRPAAIGLDILYTGEGMDPSADRYLAYAAAEGNNVVAAGAAEFGTGLGEKDGEYYIDDRKIIGWEPPFPELSQTAKTAHINTMEDTDAVLRHGLLYIDLPDGERIPSFSRALYEAWCASEGIQPNPEPETAGGFFYIPFTKKPGGYSEDISVVDVLNGTLPPEFFSGKIVLIGPEAVAMQDDYRTSIEHAEPMYGVEVHANLIDAYKKNFFPKELPRKLQLMLLFVVSGAALFFFYDRRILHALAGWLGLCALWLGAAKLLYAAGGIVLHALWIPATVTALFIVSVALNYVRAWREKQKISNTFGHYVDPAVMKQLLEQGSTALELGGSLHDIAVLFVDIRGFTTMSEAMEPPQVVEIINKYLTLTTDCIMKNHGTLDKFVGDCTMAFWNAPVAQEDPAYLACCAAFDMVEGSKALGEELLQQYGRTVSFGVGVNWGPAVVGNIGAPKRMDYTAIGDTVNTAARLEANAPGGTVYISRAVADLLGDRAEVTVLDPPIRLKGKAEGFEVLILNNLKR